MQKALRTVEKIKNALFYLTLGTLAIIGLLWFCRPTESVVEKRKLAEFPKFTMAGLWDGSFTRGIDTWYADTYPLRELGIQGYSRIQALYGNRTTQLIQNGGSNSGDRIPDQIPDASKPPATNPPSTDSTGSTEKPPATSAPEPSTEPPTEAPTEPTKDGTITTPGEMSGTLYITENTAFSLYYFGKGPVDAFTDMINHTYDVLGSKADVYCIVAPLNSGVLLDQSLQDAFNASNQEDALNYLNSRLADGVHAVDAFHHLKRHNTEYIYFRTDHHWTARGAYYAYEAFAESKGIEPHKLEQFQQLTFDGFLGTSYASSQSAALRDHPDTVYAYVPMGTNDMTMRTADGDVLAWRIVNDVSNYDSGGKYYCFSGSDQPYAYAHNPTISDGSACVVIKDSYGNAFIPFLIDHYEYVYWIDFRYYDGTLTDLVEEKGIQDIIYCINIYNTTVDSMVASMRRLVP